MKKFLALMLLFPLSAFATTTVAGKMQNLGTGNVTNGSFVRFWLRGCGGNQPRVNGTALIAPTQGGSYYFDIAANSSGNVSGTIYSTRDAAGTGNGDIECGGSMTAVWYGMQAFTGGKGGPEVAVHAKKTATLDISNVTPITTNPVNVAPTGDTNYLRLDGGNSPVTGSTTFSSNLIVNGLETIGGLATMNGGVQATTVTTPHVLTGNLSDVLIVDGITYTTIAAAITAAGANTRIILIPSTYAGSECPAALVNNLTFWDFRGGAVICSNNFLSYNTLSGAGLVSMLRGVHTANSMTGGGNVSGYFQNVINNSTFGGGTADGGSFELDVSGTGSGTSGTLNAAEDASLVTSTGGTINQINGTLGYVNSGVSSTTAINLAVGIDAAGCKSILGVAPRDCVGVFGEQQTAGSRNNYAGWFLGTVFAQSAGGSSGVLPTFNPANNSALVVGDANVLGGSGTIKAYGIVGTAKVTSDAVGDRAYGGWFKTSATTNAGTEVAVHAETGDAGGTQLEAIGGGTTAFSIAANKVGIFVGVAPDGGGFKHKRFGGVLGGTCPTAAAIGAACTSANLNWTTTFPDNNYTVTCSLVGTMTAQPHIVSTTLQAAGAGITITIAADTAVAANVASAGFVDCIAVHD